jgi:molecular chaperone HscB
MNTYFDWFAIPMQFKIDEAALRKLFLKKSKQLHPDFHTDAPDSAQADILQQATFNNEAYKVLADFDSRLQYMLEAQGLLGDAAKDALPQSFLLEMMDINEALMEVEMGSDSENILALRQNINEIETAIYLAVNEQLSTENAAHLSPTEWEKIKIFYLKRRYLLRIQKKLLTFAAQ